MGIKNFLLQTTTDVIFHANVVAPGTADPSSISGLTRMRGHRDGKEQTKL
jgi:hypothetical protein